MCHMANWYHFNHLEPFLALITRLDHTRPQLRNKESELRNHSPDGRFKDICWGLACCKPFETVRIHNKGRDWLASSLLTILLHFLYLHPIWFARKEKVWALFFSARTSFCPAQPTPWPREAATSSVFERPGTAGNGRELQVLQGPEVEFSPVGNHFDQSELSPGMQQHGSQWRSFDLRRHLLCYTSGASRGHTGWICQGVTSNVTSQRDLGREWGRN